MSIQVGLVQNVYLNVPNFSSTLIYGSCDQNNRTCQLFNNSLNFFRNQLNDELNTSFYLLQYPPRNLTDLLWTFDRSINDESNFVYMTQKGVVSCISPGIYGPGAALVFNVSYCFVYNVTGELQQSIFINGQLDSSVIPSGGLNPMTNISLTIGNIQKNLDNSQAYHGYIDQLSYSSRPKSSSEILGDATLVFYFAFNNNSFLDSGPNRIIGTPYNVILINDALQFLS
ncbi:unnamed protein product [Adineta ricciae]|uniref:Uncharacterized protein n=1 Tax=Adineta ricciae TaxID=249248 RepID=A0A815GFM5_ADIRI|nr:unnamed protein product [Adineta ricciae]CAF1458433.1 unnamed protein product [Adineta ricciae]